MMNRAWRVVIVDDEPLARETLRLLLTRETDFLLAGESTHAKDAIEAIGTVRPDVVFLDVHMPERRRLRGGPSFRYGLAAACRVRDGFRAARLTGVRGSGVGLPAEAVHRRTICRRVAAAAGPTAGARARTHQSAAVTDAARPRRHPHRRGAA